MAMPWQPRSPRINPAFAGCTEAGAIVLTFSSISSITIAEVSKPPPPPTPWLPGRPYHNGVDNFSLLVWIPALTPHATGYRQEPGLQALLAWTPKRPVIGKHDVAAVFTNLPAIVQ
jgi:hypothetical protein